MSDKTLLLLLNKQRGNLEESLQKSGMEVILLYQKGKK
jgi:hypothetical protein